MNYLVCTKNNPRNMLTGVREKRCHDVTADGKAKCNRAAGIEAGIKGWQVMEYEPGRGELCSYCLKLQEENYYV